MSSEYNDLQAAKEAAKGISKNATTLLGVGWRKAVTTAKDVHSQLTTPLSVAEQAQRTVQTKEKRAVRNTKLGQIAWRVSGRLLGDTTTGLLSITRGALEGAAGYIDKTTKQLAKDSTPPREAGDNSPTTSEDTTITEDKED